MTHSRETARELEMMRVVEAEFRGVWSYERSDRDPGAFRAISVSHLLGDSPSIRLYEWSTKSQPANSNPTFASKPKYVAISHVWKASQAVEVICAEIHRPLRIQKPDGEHEMNWYGLCQAARAAHDLGCEFIWLDLLCIDQVPRIVDGRDDKEKSLQVKNMGRIYERASAVLVMVGGVGAVQSIDDVSAWIDRAWTLQEASLCENTFALVQWPTEYPETFIAPPVFRDNVKELDPKQFEVSFNRVRAEKSIAMIPLKKLLRLELIGVEFLPDGFSVKCFESSQEGAKVDRLHLNAGRLALLEVLEEKDGHMRQCGAWRSMLLRISERPQDMVFSMMHLLGVDIVVDYERSLKGLYEEVVKKVAIKGLPAWLGVGGSNGDVIPRHLSFDGDSDKINLSGLCPELPIYEARLLPKYKVPPAQTLLPVAMYISRLADYISHFDLSFNLTCSRPHICSRMFKFFPMIFPDLTPFPGDVGQYQMASLAIEGGATGFGSFKGTLGPDTSMVIIGRAGRLRGFAPPVNEPTHNSWYVNFVEKQSGIWTRVGSGMFQIVNGDLLTNRTHIAVSGREEGEQARWDCDGIHEDEILTTNKEVISPSRPEPAIMDTEPLILPPQIGTDSAGLFPPDHPPAAKSSIPPSAEINSSQPSVTATPPEVPIPRPPDPTPLPERFEPRESGPNHKGRDESRSNVDQAMAESSDVVRNLLIALCGLVLGYILFR